jgi:hydroxypyruvate isomerase
MGRIGVCIEPFFTGSTMAEKLRRIHEIGFSSYEFWFHDKTFTGSALVDEMKDFDAIAELNHKYGLRTNDFVLNHPDGGIVAALIKRDDKARILENLEHMISLAKKIGCDTFISGSGNHVPGMHASEAVDAMVEALVDIGKVCKAHDMKIILEPFNTRVDHPDYFLDDPEMAVQILKEVGNDHVKMLFDIYHMQIMHGDILSFIRKNLDYIGHFHIAGVPGRKEPIDNELNYPFIIKEIESLGYQGYFGLEYWPTGDSEVSLRNTLRHLTK